MSVWGLVESIAAVDLGVADADVVAGVLADVRRVRGWLDSVEVAAQADEGLGRMDSTRQSVRAVDGGPLAFQAVRERSKR